jgi:dipeptidyl aminopeptidase/acylaminoacyl peptidase
MRKAGLSVVFFLLCAVSAAAQAPAEIAPADNLVVDGIPKVPAALADAASRYTEFRSAFIESWHPTRREMLIGTRFADTSQVHLVKSPGGARTQLTFFKDSAGGASFQPTQGGYFVFAKDSGGDEFFQKYKFDMATGNITLLTDGKSRNIGGVWSNAGDRYAYGSTRRNGKDVDVYVMNPAVSQGDHLLAQVEGGGWSVLDWSSDDKQLLVSQEISANESYLWLCDSGSGKMTLLTPKVSGLQISYNGGEFSKNGQAIYVTTDKDSEFQRLARIDLATKKHTFLTTRLHWDVDEFRLSWDGRILAFVSNEDGLSVLHLLDVTTGKERIVPELPVGVMSGMLWHKNNRDLAFGLETARSPFDVYSLDVTTGKVDRWTHSETGGINTANFAEPELVHWKSLDGKTISGFLYRAPERFTGPRPVAIEIHGGPEGQSRPGFLGRNSYLLNELGVDLIFPNVRGSTGYGKTFLALDNGFLREGSYKDINALFDWIAARPDLDRNRILVTGGSYGGHMTLAVSTFYSDRIRCSLDIVGMSNLVTFLEHTQEYRRDLRRVEYGDERDPKMREFLERIAPMNNIAQIKKPLFVVAGQNDPRVPASESQQIVDAVKKNGTPVWFLMAKDEGHGYRKKSNNDFLFYSTILFIQQFLLN